jgi:hypothetical protein
MRTVQYGQVQLFTPTPPMQQPQKNIHHNISTHSPFVRYEIGWLVKLHPTKFLYRTCTDTDKQVELKQFLSAKATTKAVLQVSYLIIEGKAVAVQRCSRATIVETHLLSRHYVSIS